MFSLDRLIGDTNYLFISELTSCNANCKVAPAESNEMNDPAFVEPMPGTKPSKTIKKRDVNTDIQYRDRLTQKALLPFR